MVVLVNTTECGKTVFFKTSLLMVGGFLIIKEIKFRTDIIEKRSLSMAQKDRN